MLLIKVNCFDDDIVCSLRIVCSLQGYIALAMGNGDEIVHFTTLVSHHHSHHAVPLTAAGGVTVDGLGDHAKLHGHVEVLPSLLNIMLLLRAFEGEVRGAAGVRDALIHGGLGPPGREQSLDSLSFADEDAERLFGGALHVVDGTAHRVAVESVHVFLAHAKSIDQELESLVLGAVVEENVVGDGGEGLLVLVAVLEGIIVNPVFLDFRLGRGWLVFFDRSARRLMSLPVSFLTVLVAVGDELAAGTQQEVDVRLCARCAAATLRLRYL